MIQESMQQHLACFMNENCVASIVQEGLFKEKKKKMLEFMFQVRS